MFEAEATDRTLDNREGERERSNNKISFNDYIDNDPM